MGFKVEVNEATIDKIAPVLSEYLFQRFNESLRHFVKLNSLEINRVCKNNEVSANQLLNQMMEYRLYLIEGKKNEKECE